MRTFGSAVFGLLAVLLTAAAFCGAWLNTNVASEDGFAALGQPLAEDEELQQELAAALSARAAGSVDLPGPLAGMVEPLVTSAVEGVQDLPEYPQAWGETLRRSHALTFDGGSAAEGTLTLDVGPLVSLVTESVGGELNVDVPDPGQVPVEVNAAGRAQLLANVQRAGEAWPVLALAAGVAGILALLIARRRSTAFALMGLGVALAGAVLWLAAGIFPERVAAQQFGNAVASSFAEAFAGQAAESLRTWTVYLMLGGAAALVAGLLARVVRGSRR